MEDEWELKDALKAHMATGFKTPSFTLVNVKEKAEVKESLDPEKFLTLVAPVIGTMKAAQAIVVDPVKADALVEEPHR